MWLFKKRYNFFSMLEDQAKKVRESLACLIAFFDNPDSAADQKVKTCEQEADQLRMKLVNALNASFITPIDREDIYNLSRAIDDVADYARTTVAEMKIFKVKPTPYLRDMALALENGTRLLVEAIALLGSSKKDKNTIISDYLLKVKKTENAIERKYRQALSELFSSSDMIEILKTREIYRHMSNAADRMDQAANILGDILMKAG
ncbi:DUF47 domain-containing protein [Elusimicrobiota bacterium]